MLITRLKPKEEVLPLLPEKVFVLQCHGCREISFPVSEAEELTRALLDACR